MSDEKKYKVIIEETLADEPEEQDAGATVKANDKAQKQNRSAWIITVVIVFLAVLVSVICMINESALK